MMDIKNFEALSKLKKQMKEEAKSKYIAKPSVDSVSVQKQIDNDEDTHKAREEHRAELKAAKKEFKEQNDNDLVSAIQSRSSKKQKEKEYKEEKLKAAQKLLIQKNEEKRLAEQKAARARRIRELVERELVKQAEKAKQPDKKWVESVVTAYDPDTFMRQMERDGFVKETLANVVPQKYHERTLSEEDKQAALIEERRAMRSAEHRRGKKEEKIKQEAAENIVHTVVTAPSSVTPNVNRIDKKEKLIDIVDSIDSSVVLRRKYHLEVYARVHCMIDGEYDTLWFLPNVLNYDAGNDKELGAFGRFVPQYSQVAISLQCIDVGASYDYEQKNRIKRIVKHCAILENRTDLQNHTIAIAEDKLEYQYRNIHEFLESLRENWEQIQSIKDEISRTLQLIEDLKAQGSSTSSERGALTKSISKLEEQYRILTQQQEDLKNITIYIHKQGELRYKHVIDKIQIGIMSQHLYDGKTIIIDGGPGTGKTTTMIHRLGYLTNNYALQEDERLHTNKFKLNSEQRQQLFEAIASERDWMFFSPSKLLKEYLSDAMNKEGLANTSMKVWCWKDYCEYILQVNYRLLESDTNSAPFIKSDLNETLFYQKSGIIKELEDYFIGQLRLIKSRLPEIKAEGPKYEWTVIVSGIKQRFEESDNYDLPHFVRLFVSLNSVYGSVSKDLLRNNKLLIQELSGEIYQLLEKNKDIKYELEDLLDLTDELTEGGDDDYTEEDTDYIQKAIGQWLKRYSYSTINTDEKLDESQKMMSELLLPLFDSAYNDRIQKIGQLVLFEQFAKYTNGVTSVLFSGFAGMYKRFRKHILRQKLEGCNLPLLKELIQSHNGKDLHYQEQSLLVGFINTIVKQIKNTGKKEIKHPFIEAYEDIARPIIGIDEATDFCECDIYAMQSLLAQGFNSLTLCGDMMQRLTEYGITSWDEIKDIVPNPVVVEMKTSYRQSTKVLEVARQLYKDTIGITPSYKAYMRSTRVPKPLVYVSKDEFQKIGWIEKRIEEVYRAYGQQLPSIAIFVNDKGYIPRFIERLERTEFFSSNNIKVIDGTKDNLQITESHISVYPIDVVKGMEFDVVFFHNIDNSYLDAEFLKRYIYVGVSRAAFFLGITLKEWNEELCKYFETDKDWFKI